MPEPDAENLEQPVAEVKRPPPAPPETPAARAKREAAEENFRKLHEGDEKAPTPEEPKVTVHGDHVNGFLVEVHDGTHRTIHQPEADSPEEAHDMALDGHRKRVEEIVDETIPPAVRAYVSREIASLKRLVEGERSARREPAPLTPRRGALEGGTTGEQGQNGGPAADDDIKF